MKEETFSFKYDRSIPQFPEGIKLRIENGCDWYMWGERGYQDFNSKTVYTFGRIGDRIVVSQVMNY